MGGKYCGGHFQTIESATVPALHDACSLPGLCLLFVQNALPLDLYLAHSLKCFYSLPTYFLLCKVCPGFPVQNENIPNFLIFPCLLFPQNSTPSTCCLFHLCILCLLLSLNCKCSLRERVLSLLFIAISPELEQCLTHSVDSINFCLSQLKSICLQKM